MHTDLTEISGYKLCTNVLVSVVITASFLSSCMVDETITQASPEICVVNDSIFIVVHDNEEIVCNAISPVIRGHVYRNIEGDMPEERVGDHIINKMPLNRFVRSKGRYFEGVMHNDIPESIILGFGEDRNSRIVMQYVLQADTLEPLFGNLAVLTKSMAGYIYVKIDLDHIQENMERDHNH